MSNKNSRKNTGTNKSKGASQVKGNWFSRLGKWGKGLLLTGGTAALIGLISGAMTDAGQYVIEQAKSVFVNEIEPNLFSDDLIIDTKKRYGSEKEEMVTVRIRFNSRDKKVDFTNDPIEILNTKVDKDWFALKPTFKVISSTPTKYSLDKNQETEINIKFDLGGVIPKADHIFEGTDSNVGSISVKIPFKADNKSTSKTVEIPVVVSSPKN